MEYMYAQWRKNCTVYKGWWLVLGLLVCIHALVVLHVLSVYEWLSSATSYNWWHVMTPSLPLEHMWYGIVHLLTFFFFYWSLGLIQTSGPWHLKQHYETFCHLRYFYRQPLLVSASTWHYFRSNGKNRLWYPFSTVWLRIMIIYL